MLTDEQKHHYEVFGFLHLRQVLTLNEVDTIRRESDRILAKLRDRKPFPGKKRQAEIPFFEHSPVLTKFIGDDRIYMIGVDLLGPDIILNATEGNLHVGDTQWHGAVDRPHPVPAVKIAFYLEPNTKETGALRVIPGSHKPEFGKMFEPLGRQHEDPSVMPFGVPGEEIPSVVLETQPGDLVVFPERLWHGAFGGRPGRTQHAINYHANPATDEQKEALRRLYERFRFSLHPPVSLIHSESPRLRSLVERWSNLDLNHRKFDYFIENRGESMYPFAGRGIVHSEFYEDKNE